MTLTLTHECNLSCVYCYENAKTKSEMPLVVAKTAISKFFDSISPDQEVEIAFHGGEPFLSFSVIQELCEWFWARKWHAPYIFFASTNGTLIHGHIRDWVERHRERFWLGLSLDGTKQMQDLNRSQSFDSIDIDFFLRTWPNQPIKMTVSRSTLAFMAEGIIWLHKRGFRINANLAYGTDWADPSMLAELEQQLAILVRFYQQHPQYEPSGPLSMRIDAVGSAYACSHKWCGVGTDMLTIDTDGLEYPCHLFLPMTTGQRAVSAQPIDWRSSSAVDDARCRDCAIWKICPTCYGMNIIERGAPALRDEHRCTMTKMQALASSYLQAHLLTNNQVPVGTPEQAARVLRQIAAIEEIQAKLVPVPMGSVPVPFR